MKISITVFLFFLTGVFDVFGESGKTSFRFAGIPAVGYNPDSGFGFGVVGSMYVDQDDYLPYKMALGLKVYLTTKGENSHLIKLDQVNAFGLPLRLLYRVGFYSTIGQNYCGRASDASCDPEQAHSEHYYKNRMMLFYGDLGSRWLLWKDVAKLELMVNYRGSYYLNRDFKHKGPYEGSLYQRDFKENSDGYLSTVELGLMLDKRDQEAAPTKGYWLEGSIRGSSFIIGSSWNYFGANAAARFYFPLDDAHRLVIASQTIGDIIVGGLPFDAISRVGGSSVLNDVTAIGGQNIGRGIRDQRYVGRIKFIEQAEFRYTFWSFLLFKQHFDLNWAVITDLAMTAWDFSRFSKDMQHVYAGFGTGLRIYWNERFVIRGDLGISPSENFSPKFYLTVGNVF